MRPIRWTRQSARKAGRRNTLALGTVIGLLVVGGALAAFATDNPCHDEGVAGGDIGNDFGPGLLFVGADSPSTTGGLNNFTAVCVASGGALPFSNESVQFQTADPTPASSGATVAVSRRSCTLVGGVQNCTTTSVVGQTGAEAGAAGATPDLPGGGTLGTTASVGGHCTWVNGAQSCAPVSSVAITGWETDMPQKQDGGCLVDVDPGAGCEVSGTRAVLFGDAASPTLRVSRTGLPAGNGDTDVAPQRTCVGLANPC